jgi:hypothetical protein
MFVTTVSDLWQVYCFSQGTPISSTNKINHYEITKILLKVALKTTTLPPTIRYIALFTINCLPKVAM